jgi:ankyrin repeat protein
MAPAATVAVWIWLAVPVALIVVGTIVLIAVFGRRPRDSYDRSQPRHVYQNDARAMAMPDARIAPDRAAPASPPQFADSGAIGRHEPARDTKFTYTTGDRPLDGYTIKRGVGRGGFGEVYYATSDGGKEVALKLVQRHLDVELRGVSQCLNLKHPHLVTLYDVRQSQNGDHWIVMEYVSGECLGDAIARHPGGLSADQVNAWLRSICAGVGHLHDQGIVHRDLKPGNIFVEHGIVKIGDYGLAKFISASRRSGQTESVGTVHYMAPEVSRGRYGKEIDLYALGVILFEMLTGRVPFSGQSPGEILMRHLTEPPDVSAVPAPYRTIVARLLAKEPEQRYASVGALVDELDGRAAPSANPNESPALRPVVAPMLLPATRAWREHDAERLVHAPKRRRSLAAVALAIGVGLVVVAGLFAFRARTALTAPALLERDALGLLAIAAIVALGAGAIATARPGRFLRAARRGDIAELRRLLESGVDVNCRRLSGRTALTVAAEHGHAAVVRMLLERRADPDARRRDGETALSLAATAGHAAVVEALLAAGADVNPRASDGDTPLIEAAYAGHVAILRMLLDHRADTTARSGYDGSTPLIWAAYGGHTGCVEALLEHGANVNEKDTGDGSTPLIWAAWGNHPNVVRVLLDHGADPSETNSSGETAADHAESETVKAMLEAAMARR